MEVLVLGDNGVTLHFLVKNVKEEYVDTTAEHELYQQRGIACYRMIQKTLEKSSIGIYHIYLKKDGHQKEICEAKVHQSAELCAWNENDVQTTVRLHIVNMFGIDQHSFYINKEDDEKRKAMWLSAWIA